MRGYFNGYDGDVAWADNIRQNAANIVAELTPADINTSPPPTESTFTLNTADVVEEVGGTASLPNTNTEALSAPKDLPEIPQTIQEN